MTSSTPAILPLAKRRKKGQVGPHIFLDSIPEVILDNLLRYFSRLPNSKKWETHINVRNLVEAFEFGGGSGTLLKSRFRTLVVSKTKKCYETKDLGWKELTMPYLWTSEISVAHAFVTAGGGEALRTLVLSHDMYERGRDGENLVDDFAKHCPNVTSLSIAEEGEMGWTNKFGCQLEILEVCAGVPLSIPERAPTLLELNMTPYFGNWNLLRRIGGSLESLVVHEFYLQVDDDADKIKLHCPNLKSVSLKGRSSLDCRAIAQMLASYGDRLEYALFYCLDHGQIRYVTAACPNARFHLSMAYEFGLSLSTLNLIGTRLERVTLLYTEPVEMDYDLVDRTNAWNQCLHLREISFVSSKVEDFQAVFSTPKHHLVSIELGLGNSFERRDVKKVMENCAPWDDIEELDVFIEKNRATLRSIELGFYFADGNKKLDKLLQSIIRLPALEELYVDYEIPQGIMRSLRINVVYFCRERPNL